MTAKSHYRALVRIATFQTAILVAAWIFFIVVRIKNPLILPHRTALWVSHNPTNTTIVVTLIATVLSYVTTKFCFAEAVKHALRRRVTEGPITLTKFQVGISVSGTSLVFNPRYLLQTLAIFLAFTVLTSAWTAFLVPTTVVSQVQLNGYELDLTSASFDTLLGNDFDAIVSARGDYVFIPTMLFSLTAYGLMSGITAAVANATGQVGRLDINLAQYNKSTGGILPAVAGFLNNSIQQRYGWSAITFVGGPIPPALTPSPNVGLLSNYTVKQQGLTASVSCVDYDPASAGGVALERVTAQMDWRYGDGFSGTSATSSAIAVTCRPGQSTTYSSMAPLTLNNTSGVSMLICPDLHLNEWYEVDTITIILQGEGGYDFLPLTLCEITPTVTNLTVDYATQMIMTTGVLDTNTISYQQHLFQWIVQLLSAQIFSYQSGTGNFMGDMLRTLIDGDKSPTDQGYQAQALVSEFLRGVVELLGTHIRSGYTAYPQNVTHAMLTPMTGVQNVTTMGWSFTNAPHVYPPFIITLTAIMTYVAIYFAIRPTRGYESVQPEHPGLLADAIPAKAMSTFDATNPIHLIVASATEKLTPSPGTSIKDESTFWKQYEETVVSFRGENAGSVS